MGQLSEEPLRTGTEDQIDEMKLCLVSHQITDNWSVSQSATAGRAWSAKSLQQFLQSPSQRERKEGGNGAEKFSFFLLHIFGGKIDFTHISCYVGTYCIFRLPYECEY